MQKFLKITVNYPVGKNFTPSDVMGDWAKQNSLIAKKEQSVYGGSFLVICGEKYTYHHYDISKVKNGTADVTLFMEKEEIGKEVR